MSSGDSSSEREWRSKIGPGRYVLLFTTLTFAAFFGMNVTAYFAQPIYYPLILFWLALMTLSAYHMLRTGELIIDDKAVTYKTLGGTLRLPWREIEKIDCDNPGNLIFEGHGKRLCVHEFYFWQKKTREEMRAFLGKKVQQHGIKFEKSAFPEWKFSRNTQELDKPTLKRITQELTKPVVDRVTGEFKKPKQKPPAES